MLSGTGIVRGWWLRERVSRTDERTHIYRNRWVSVIGSCDQTVRESIPNYHFCLGDLFQHPCPYLFTPHGLSEAYILHISGIFIFFVCFPMAISIELTFGNHLINSNFLSSLSDLCHFSPITSAPDLRSYVERVTYP